MMYQGLKFHVMFSSIATPHYGQTANMRGRLDVPMDTVSGSASSTSSTVQMSLDSL